MFLRHRLSIALAGLLALSIVLSAGCNDDSADAKETATETAATTNATTATSTTSIANTEPTNTAASATETVAADEGSQETAVPQSTDPATGTGATVAAPEPTSGESLPGLEGYLDNRSGPVAVLESLYSAINLQQYARAYSYWEASDTLPAFADFEAGYANTETVELTTGEISTDVGAGQLYFGVPVTLDVTTTDGGTQIFAGCYVLHLARPEMQVEPPYSPLAIASADISEVASDAAASARMAEGCP
jgi:hypothetical protein